MVKAKPDTIYRVYTSRENRFNTRFWDTERRCWRYVNKYKIYTKVYFDKKGNLVKSCLCPCDKTDADNRVTALELCDKYCDDCIHNLKRTARDNLKELANEAGISLEQAEHAIFLATKRFGVYDMKTFEKILSDPDRLDYRWKLYKSDGGHTTDIFAHMGKVDKPIFIRKPENSNKKTFDYIHLSVGICGKDIDKKEWCREHIKEIVDRMTYGLSINKSFTKYGIPTNFLRVTNAVYTKDDMLQLTYELKDIPS